MTDETPAAAPPTLEELRAQAAALQKQIDDAEAAEAAPMPTVEEAQAALTAAEANLEATERSFWDVEHARIALNEARRNALTATTEKKAAMEALVPVAEQALNYAVSTHTNSGTTAADIDRAAQAVLDARDVLASAQEAHSDG